MFAYALNILALMAVSANASPFPQGVTMAISPSGTVPESCTASYDGSFGIALMSLTAGGGDAVATQSADGQPGAATTAGAVTQISDAQPQAPTGGVSQISDGQPQAPTSVVSQISDGQPQAPSAAVSQINDGQPQAPSAAVSQIGDGQPQAPTGAVSQISDGQPQAPTNAVSQISDGQPQAPTMTMHAMTQIGDGQVQGYYTQVTAVSQLGDGQPQAPSSMASGVSQLSDGQPQALTGTAASQLPDGQPQASSSSDNGSGSGGTGATPVACNSDSTLALTLTDGVLRDAQGRTGYIASNYQFQFDDPPQAGAIYTAGFSVCGNGSLALGDTAVWYQCLSGDFYNLYSVDWADQCEGVTVQVVGLVDC
ncbi:hypothetical protein K431DRAFT_301363 [Polychaeton citri CBS 116435]|uniref:Cell wall mannoprotein PIR1-like C-terminal domain-containing protein n=1 Tax=Polychaeton citri CBS 116435 TaxID=1314669 RepID=A0A9P4USN2_9PEZI|nr:hypothetical protein K431DRAFT_301363 [Polychaeton citri CBS 116435]